MPSRAETSRIATRFATSPASRSFARPWDARKSRTTSRVSASTGEHVEYTRAPPGRNALNAEARSCLCSLARPGMSFGSLRQRASGRRRSAPRPEHGASTSTRSYAFGSCTPSSRPSPRRRATVSSHGSTDAATRSRRCSCGSFAWMRAPRPWAIAARVAVFPPGPAHMSSHSSSLPSMGAAANSAAISWLPSSWTPASPSRTGYSRCGSPRPSNTALGMRQPGNASIFAASTRSARASEPIARAASATFAGALCAARTDSTSSLLRPEASSDSSSASTIHLGCECQRERNSVCEAVDDRTISGHWPAFSLMRRKTALTNPPVPWPKKLRAMTTVSWMAACGGVSIASSCSHPILSRSRTGGSMS